VSLERAGVASPCAEDCSTIKTPQCLESYCDGATRTCKVRSLADNVACDDGLFCTVGELCTNGVCGGGLPNKCNADACSVGTCDEAQKTCQLSPAPDGSACELDDPCTVSATCKQGTCIGRKKSCAFAPGVDDCNLGVCDSATGACRPVPANEGAECKRLDDGRCAFYRTCKAGACQGGVDPCSINRLSCAKGSCNPLTGSCNQAPVAAGGTVWSNGCESGVCNADGTVLGSVASVGTPCSAPGGSDQCNTGSCQVATASHATRCLPTVPTNEGGACDTFDLCSVNNACHAGSCKGGTPPPGTTVYLRETFDDGASTWALAPGAFKDLFVSKLTTSEAFYYWLGDPPYGAGNAVRPLSPGHTPVANGGFLAGPLYTNSLWSFQQGTTYYATSPAVDVTKAGQSLFLTFWRWVVIRNDDYTVGDVGGTFLVEVFNGKQWRAVVQQRYPIFDYAWHPYVFDVSADANPAFRVRFGFVDDAGTYGHVMALGIDDVTVASKPCASTVLE
jgi:hypothetical protein